MHSPTAVPMLWVVRRSVGLPSGAGARMVDVVISRPTAGSPTVARRASSACARQASPEQALHRSESAPRGWTPWKQVRPYGGQHAELPGASSLYTTFPPARASSWAAGRPSSLVPSRWPCQIALDGTQTCSWPQRGAKERCLRGRSGPLGCLPRSEGRPEQHFPHSGAVRPRRYPRGRA